MPPDLESPCACAWMQKACSRKIQLLIPGSAPDALELKDTWVVEDLKWLPVFRLRRGYFHDQRKLGAAHWRTRLAVRHQDLGLLRLSLNINNTCRPESEVAQARTRSGKRGSAKWVWSWPHIFCCSCRLLCLLPSARKAGWSSAMQLLAGVCVAGVVRSFAWVR